MWTYADASLYNTATVRSLLLAGLRRKVPVFGFSPQFVRAGALLGVGISPTTQGEQAAAIALRLLRAPSASQPLGHEVEAPQYQVAVNLIVTEALGLEVPSNLVDHAAFVFRKEAPR